MSDYNRGNGGYYRSPQRYQQSRKSQSSHAYSRHQSHDSRERSPSRSHRSCRDCYSAESWNQQHPYRRENYVQGHHRYQGPLQREDRNYRQQEQRYGHSNRHRSHEMHRSDHSRRDHGYQRDKHGDYRPERCRQSEQNRDHDIRYHSPQHENTRTCHHLSRRRSSEHSEKGKEMKRVDKRSRERSNHRETSKPKKEVETNKQQQPKVETPTVNDESEENTLLKPDELDAASPSSSDSSDAFFETQMSHSRIRGISSLIDVVKEDEIEELVTPKDEDNVPSPTMEVEVEAPGLMLEKNSTSEEEALMPVLYKSPISKIKVPLPEEPQSFQIFKKSRPSFEPEDYGTSFIGELRMPTKINVRDCSSPRRTTCLSRPIIHDDRFAPALRPGWGSSYIDKYDLREKIGSGSYGWVYKGIDKTTRQKIAAKLLVLDGEKQGFPLSSIREIKVLRLLDHRNIVKLLDVATGLDDTGRDSQGNVYLVFEYAEHDLRGLLGSGLLSPNFGQIAGLFKQLLEGLLYCHKKNIMHRDLKCSNILLNNRGEIKLADFGLARTFDHSNIRPYTCQVITLWYRSPELLLGDEHYGPSVDIWSAGCILGELFRHRPLFQGSTELEQLEEISKICGTPCPNVWPGVTTLPLYNTMIAKRLFKRELKNYYHRIPVMALDLLDAMLRLDPTKRPTCGEAIMFPFLTGIDYNRVEPLRLPTDQDCHEQWLKQGQKNGRFN